MGKVKVTVQTEKRLEAINNLSIAIRKVAEALAIGTKVEIIGSVIKGNNAIEINNAEKITETKIEALKDD